MFWVQKDSSPEPAVYTESGIIKPGVVVTRVGLARGALNQYRVTCLLFSISAGSFRCAR